MKKVLFATTALIATAGVAAADVSFSGYGRFGAEYKSKGSATVRAAANAKAAASAAAAAAARAAVNSATTVNGAFAADKAAVAAAETAAEDAAAAAAAATDVTQMTSRFRLNIDASTEADNGLTFGARIRIQDSASTAGVLNGANFYVKAGGLKVAVGNTPGAIDAQNGAYAQSLGLTGLGYHNVVANSAVKGFWGFDDYSSGANGRETVAISYSAGDFGVMASYSDTAGESRSSIGASYTFSGWTVALAYQDSNVNANDKTVLTVAGNVGIADLNFAVADNNGTLKYGIGADFSVGAATTVSAFVNSEDTAGEAYGLGVKHDLGGGASIRGGVVQTAAGQTLADLGLHFNF